MACYDRVSCSVDPDTGALTVNTKRGSCTITPGDTVTFTETGVGYIITINGEPNVIPKPDEDDYGDNVSFTETEDSYIITINNEPNVINKVCQRLIDCNGNDIDPCVDRVATCENLDSEITRVINLIPDVPAPTPQTRVQRGTGNAASQRTLTANHDGTWPNEQWRETWMERNGDIVTIHSWNPNSNSWDRVSVEAPEGLVILNNPVIYLRTDGSANPPIETQADLTPENAFDTFDSIRTFLQRTLLVGSITVDGRGDYSAPGFNAAGHVAASTFKNAANIIVRGDPDDVEAFVLPFGGTTGRSTGLACGNGNVTIRNLTFRCVNEAEAGTIDFIAAVNTGGGAITFANTVRFDGYYDNDRPNRTGPAYISRMITGGSVSVASNANLIFDFDIGTAFVAMSFVGPQGTHQIAGNVTFDILGGCEFRRAQFDVDSSSFLRFTLSSAAPNPLEVTGNSRFTSSHTARISDLGVSSGHSSYGSRSDLIAYDFGADVSDGGAQAEMLVSPLGVVNSVAGP